MIRKMRAVSTVALMTGVGLFAAACGNGATTTPAAPPAAEGGAAATGACEAGSSITLDSFVNWDPQVIADFEAHYGVTVNEIHYAQSTDLRDAVVLGLSQGGVGVGDVVTIEGDLFSEFMVHPDDWVTLPEIPGRWLGWAEDEGRVGGALKGYRTDIGPLAIIYNARILEEHGFGQYADPAAFSAWIGGQNATWDTFLNAGREFVAANPGIAWVDDIGNGPARAALRQLPAAFEDPATGQPTDLAGNTAVHNIFLQMGEAMADGLGAGVPFWDGAWGSAMLADEFVAMVAPPWQIGWPLAASGAHAGDWRIAEVFPDGGGNWGGTFIGVTAHGANHDCAIALADWLTNDETAATQWAAEGSFPSQTAVLNAGIVPSPEHAPLFGTQDYTETLGNLAEHIPGATYRGANFGWIQDDAIFHNLGTVQDGINTPAQAWDAAVAYFNSRR